MKRKVILIVLVAILIFSNILWGCLLFKERSITIYKTDILTDDIDIDNFSLVSIGTKLYVQDGYIFKLKKQAKVDSINFNVYIDGTEIADFAGGKNFEKSNERIVDNFNVIPNIKISKDSKMKVSIKYTINGDGREFYDTILLNSIIKYKDNEYKGK